MRPGDPGDMALSRRWTRNVLVGATALVSLAGLTVELLKSHYRWKGRAGVVPLLSLSYEQNLPTYFTAVLLLCASASAALLAASARRNPTSKLARRDAFAWGGLCAGFLYISIDEVLEIHEHWGSGIHLKGLLHFSWVVPATGILAVLAVLYAGFLLRMPRGPRMRLILAGAVYVMGAVVLELPLGAWTEAKGEKTLGYALIDWVEETMEMTGIVLYLLTAFDLLAERGVRLRFGAPPPTDPRELDPKPESESATPADDSP